MTWSEAFKAYITRRWPADSQKEAALSLGVAPSSVSYWCRGATPRKKKRADIARWSKGAVPAELHVAKGRPSTPPPKRRAA